jgi:magnesium transporter
MFRVQDFTAEGKSTVFGCERTGADAEVRSRVVRPEPGTLRWIDLESQDAESLELLRERFDFHPLAIEDCLNLDQRPKLDEYGEVLFVVTHGFTCKDHKVRALVPRELHAFLGDGYLVTVHAEPIEELEAAWKRACLKPQLATRGADFLYYLVVDAMADANFPILDKVAEELEVLEEEVLERPDRKHLARIFALKHELSVMRRVLSPQRDVLVSLAKIGGPTGEKNAAYFRDVYDHLIRISEAIDANRDLLGNAMDAYLSSVSNRTNEIMKYLTIMSALFLPLSFVVGFFGQNFDDMPGLPGWQHSHSLMWTMLGACLCVPVGMVAWFKYKRWL